MSDIVEIIVTGPPEFMPDLVETLLAERLIACGQLIPIKSTYRWQGSIEHATETRASMHTSRRHIEAVMARVREDHPYEVPCILVAPMSNAGTSYSAWVVDETTAPSR